MTTVAEWWSSFKAKDKRELAKESIRNWASNQTDFVMYAMVVFIMFVTAANTILLLQIAGYTAAELEPVSDLVIGGTYAFLAFLGLAVGKMLAQIAVDVWDAEDATAEAEASG